MRSRATDTAAVKIAFQGKHDAMGEGVIASGVDEAGLTQDRK